MQEEKVEQLISDLRKNGEEFLAFALGDTVRALNEREDRSLGQKDFERLRYYGNQLESDDKKKHLGTGLKEFADTHKPQTP